MGCFARAWSGAGGQLMLTGLAVLLCSGCPGPTDKGPDATVATPGSGHGPSSGNGLIPENCQQDSLIIYLAQDTSHIADTVVTAADIPLIRRIANLPEFHDCQRFVVSAGGSAAGEYEFGPLVAIWAADSVGTRFSQRQRGQVPRGSWGQAVPVAVIYNWAANGPYDPLGIQPDFNCLYLSHDGSTPRKWKATMVSLGRSTKPCEEAVPSDALRGTTLEVHATTPPNGLGAKDLPEVARWEWDAKNHEQYISIRCAEQWCEVGKREFAPSAGAAKSGMDSPWLRSVLEPIPGIADPLGTPEEIERVVNIKGWYDDQELDLRDGDGRPILANVQGTAIPHPALDRATFPDGEWTPVSYVMASAEYPSPKIPLAGGLNRVYLCRSGANKCAGTEGLSCATEMSVPHDTWYTRVTAQSGSSRSYCVVRRDHGGQVIPVAASRWNWNELDATTWSKCGGACCTGI